jgi:hypothetical protein
MPPGHADLGLAKSDRESSSWYWTLFWGKRWFSNRAVVLVWPLDGGASASVLFAKGKKTKDKEDGQGKEAELFQSEDKLPCVAAVSIDRYGHPLRVKLSPVNRFTSDAISFCAKAALASSSEVVSDGLACFWSVTSNGCTHQPIEALGDTQKTCPNSNGRILSLAI